MAEISNETGKPLNPTGTTIVVDPATMIPSFNTNVARQRGVEKNILIRTIGGLGDLVTSEPAIRYAVNNFDASISIEAFEPDLYRHLKFARVYKTSAKDPEEGLAIKDRFLVFKTMYDPRELHAEFLCHMAIQKVDYHTLAMWRSQIPNDEKCIELYPNEQEQKAATQIQKSLDIVLHPGRTWPSRTMPAEWWNKVIEGLKDYGYRPVLVGNDYLHDRGCLGVNSDRCLDLRNQLSVMETVSVLQKARVLITNDSAPLHMAASGRAWIGFLSTVNHPDFVMHYRNSGPFGTVFGWRMRNFSRGCVYIRDFDRCPNREGNFDFATQDITEFLPDPDQVSGWAVDKMDEDD